MKRVLLAFAFILSFIALNAQTTIWQENFNLPNNTNSYTRSLVNPPTESASWTADGTSGNASVTVNSNKLRGTRTTSSHDSWEIDSSNPIEIAGYSNVYISVKLSSDGANGGNIVTQYSVDGGTFTDFATNGNVSNDIGSIPITASQTNLSGSTLRLRIIMSVSGNNKYYFADDILVTGAQAPLLSVSALSSTPSFDDICTGFTSGPKSFVINGSNLTAPVEVAALNGYAFSKDNVNYYSSLTGVNNISASQVTATGGQTVYVKFNPTTSGSYNGNIVVSSSGATSVNAAVVGNGISIPVNASGSFPANGAVDVCSDGGGAITALAWQTVPDATLYDVYFGTTTSPTLFQSDLTTAYTTQNLNLLASTTYYWKVVPKNNCGIATVSSNWSFTTASTACNDDYCDITFTNVSPITKVTFNTIDNSSSASTSSPSYEDFKSVNTTVAQTSTHSLTVKANTGTTGNVDQKTLYVMAFFDWNHDNDFLDAGESIEIGTIFESTGIDAKYISKDIDIPAGSSLGNTVMRIIASRYDYNVNPCVPEQDGNNPNTYGQTEDYTVNVCALPVAIAQNVTLILDTNGNATLTTAAANNGSTANCGLQSLAVSKSTFTCNDLGINTGILLTVTDNLGNTDSAEVIVTVIDDIPPTITCAADVTIDTDPSECSANVIITSPVVADNCGSSSTALDFDGIDDRVILPSLNFGSEMTIEAWIYPRANTYSRILSKYPGGGNPEGAFVFDTYDGSDPPYLANGRGLRFVFTGIGSGGVMSANVLTLNSWNHVAATFNNGIVKIYVDGVEVNSGTTGFTTIPNYTLNLVIGEDSTIGANEFFNGQMDEMSLWNRALPATEISSSYNKILSGTEPGLVAYYNFEDGTGSTTLSDNSSNGNNGTLTNMDAANDWVSSSAPITSVSLTNNITGTSDASGVYTSGQPTVITWTATDSSGNTATCQQIVTVEDNEAPTITSCPSDITLQCDEDSSVAALGSATATDNCDTSPSISHTDNIASGSCSGEYVITRTWTATDDEGNSTSCEQIITIQDTTNPVLSGIPANTNASCDNIPTTASPTATDNCDSAPSISFNEANTQDANPANPGHYNYTITRTWTATDECGNSSSGSQIITVSDSENPVLSGIPANITVECDAVPSAATPTASDNCDPAPSISLNETNTQDANPANTGHYNYTITRTWRATDVSGNFTESEQIITVQDITAPSISDVADATINCEDDTSSAANGVATGTDNCSDVTITESDVSTQDADPLNAGHYNYTITRTWRATDVSGNFTESEQIITVQDITAPSISDVADVTINCEDDTSSAANGVATGTDNCSDVTITESDVSTQDADPLNAGHYNYTITRTWRATDVSGNFTESEQIITVQDITAPSISDVADVTINCEDDTSSAANGVATGTDNCSDVTITESDVSTQDADPLNAGHYNYTITRTWRATDVSGNFTESEQIITVQDITAPSISDVADATINCEDDTSSAANGVATGTDNCSDVTITESDVSTQDADPLNAGHYNYTITRTWRATDVSGNFTESEQIITVQDITAPSISDVADATINCEDDTSSAANGVATGTDNCSDVTITESDVSTQDADPLNAGHYNYTITRTWRATDVSGNFTESEQIITVQDITAPSISDVADATINCEDDTSSAANGVATGTDNCSDVTITESDVSTQDADPLNAGHYNYTITRTWRATDVSGNFTESEQIITVQDITAPSISDVADVTINCEDDTSSAANGVATGTDNCSDVTITESDVSTQDADPLNAGHYNYTITRTWRATDVSGNFTESEQIITVQDITAPSISDVADATINCEDDTSSAANGVATGTDNCSDVTITESDVSTQDADPLNAGHYNYTITRTWRATDVSGNFTESEQIITVQDITAPSISDVADATINCEDDTSSAANGVATGTDNCSDVTITESDVSTQDADPLNAGHYNYTITRTWRATDVSGNFTESEQIITVQDITAPSISDVADATINCEDDTSSAANGVATGTDNCSDVTIIESDVSTQDADPLNAGHYNYTITRTWRATDVSGNFTESEQIITVQDITAPSISDVADATINCEDDTSSAANGVATGTDNCSDVTITESDVSTQDADPLNAGHYNYTITRTWRATDVSGNFTESEQIITVQDITAPSISDVADVTINCEDDTSSAANGVATGTDNCSDVTITESDVSTQDADPLNAGHYNYTITRTWRATDVSGNFTESEQIITVQDITAPSISDVADATINCEDDTSSAANGVATGTDNCSDVTITESDVSTQDADPLNAGHYNYTITRTWRATDVSGNFTESEQIITVQDITAPSISDVADVTINCEDDTSSAANGVATGTDNCSDVTITESDVSTQDADPLNAGHYNYTITRTWRATDVSGNFTESEQIITVQDVTAPSITCPADVTIECDEDTSPATNGEATGSDNCSDVTITYSDVSTQSGGGSSNNAWINEIHYDNTGGDVGEFVEVVANFDASGYSVVFYNGNGGASYGTMPLVLSGSAGDYNFYSVGAPSGGIQNGSPDGLALVDDLGGVVEFLSYEGSFAATDGPANGTTSSDIGVSEASSAPVGTSLQLNGSGSQAADFTWTASATATAGAANTSQTLVSGGALPPGHYNYTITRTWTATDVTGNSTSCVQIITVEDTTPPSISDVADVTINCEDDTSSAANGVATGTDNCSDVTITESDVSTQDADPLNAGHYNYTITRTWRATDVSGNFTESEQIITVQDVTAPSITCPADVTIECDEDTSPATNGEATGSDNCSDVTITYSDVSTQSGGGSSNNAWINEIHYDNTGGDVGEFVEVVANFDASGYSVVFYNGNGGASYGTMPLVLSGSAGDYNFYSVGAPSGGIQNGSPDGLALVDDLGGVVEFLSYEGSFAATDGPANGTTSSDIGVSEASSAPVGTSLQLNGSGSQAADFTWTASATATAGAANTSQTLVSGGALPPGHYNYTITRTWTATDVTGNSTSCVQIITVEDTTPPSISDVADVTINCEDDTSSAANGVATGTDNCSDVTITESDVSTQDADPLNAGHYNYTITRTWRATDVSGNFTESEQIITVQDVTAPSITCPADVTIECDEDTSPATNGEATGSDNCSDVTITYSDVSTQSGGGSSNNAWINEIHYDNTGGDVGEFVEVVANFDASGYSVVFYNGNGGASYGTMPLVLSGSAGDYNFYSVGAPSGGIQNGSPDGLALVDDLGGVVEFLSYEGSFAATDGPANGTTSSDIGVSEASSAPVGTSLQLNGSGSQAADFTWTASATATAGAANTSQTLVSGGALPPGHYNYTITRTWTATDVTGNSTSCVQIITVEDTTPPSISDVADVTINCEDDTSSAANGVATGTDNCSDVTITESDVSTQDADPLNAGHYNYTITRTWRATDVSGNFTESEQIITVQDITAPSISDVADVTINCEDDTSSAANGVATGTDNCSDVTITESDVSTQDADPLNAGHYNYTITRTWRATDVSGNFTESVQIITVQDVTAPSIDTAASDLTVECDGAGNSAQLQTWLDNNGGTGSASDVCSGVTWIHDFTALSDDCGETGSATVTFTATDSSNNSVSTTATFTIEDTTDPSWTTPPADLTVECDGAGNTAELNAWLASFQGGDVCGTATQTNNFNGLSDECGATGSATVTFTLTDECGNAITADATFTIEDTTAPVLIVPADVTVNCEDDTASATNGVASATDVCSNFTITESDVSTQVMDNLDPGYYNYTITRTWSVTDECNNTSSFDQIITVQDVTPPVVDCNTIEVILNSSGNGSITAEQLNNNSNDNCSPVFLSIALEDGSFDCSDIGGDLDDLIISEYIDGDGYEKYIELYNGTGLTVDLSEYSLLVYYDGSTTATEYPLGGSVTDRQPIVIQHPNASFPFPNNTRLLEFDGDDAIALAHNGTVIDLLPVYSNTISLDGTTLRRKDTVNNGNISSATGADGWIQIGGAHDDNLLLHDIIFKDNDHNVLLTVTDTSGNVSTCVASVTVIDDTPPNANTQDITVQLDATGNVSITADQVNDGSNDACGIASLSVDPDTFDCSNVGDNTVTLTVTDNNGNVSTVDATVTVEDNVDPVVVTQDITVQLDASGNVSITANDIDDGSNDACGIDTLSVSPNSFTCTEVGDNTVTLTVTDNNGNTSTATATVTVEDNVDPQAICQAFTIGLDGNGVAVITGADVDGGSNDACGIASLSVFPNTFGCGDIGDNTVTLTVTDNNGNVSTCTTTVTVTGIIPTVSISESPLPDFCQGAVVVLTADSTEAAEYLWSTGETTDSIEVPGNGMYSVTVTSLTNCTAYAEYEVTGFDAGSLISAYTIIASEKVDLKNSVVVQSGGVGVTDSDGEIKLDKASHIIEFAQADEIEIKAGSSVGTAIYQPANPIIPNFIYNSYSNGSSPDVKANNNQTLTLNGGVYGKVEVEEDATIIFTAPNVYINELKTKKRATIEFTGCTNMFINKKFELDENGTFNSSGQMVTLYIDDELEVKKGSDFTGRVHTNDNEIKVKGGNNSDVTTMTGLFIGNKVEGDKNVIWNADYNCDTCPVEAPGNQGGEEPTEDYVIIGFDEVHLHGDIAVQTGGVGVTRHNKKLKVHDDSDIADFGKASKIQVNGGSTIGTSIYQQADPIIPLFVINTYSNNGSPDVTVNDNQTVTLNGDNYDKITVKDGGTVIFTQPNVYIEELKTEKDVSIEFTGCTNLIIKKKFKLDDRGTINSDGHTVTIYVADKVEIEKGSWVDARIFAYNDDIKIDGSNNDPTFMTGLFIGKKVHTHDNVIWNSGQTGTACAVAPPNNTYAPIIDIDGDDKLGMDVTSWPNPSDTEFNVKITSENTTDIITINVFDMSNKLVHSDEFRPDEVYKFGNRLEGGVYIVKVSQGDKVRTVRLVKY